MNPRAALGAWALVMTPTRAQTVLSDTAWHGIARHSTACMAEPNAFQISTLFRPHLDDGAHIHVNTAYGTQYCTAQGTPAAGL